MFKDTVDMILLNNMYCCDIHVLLFWAACPGPSCAGRSRLPLRAKPEKCHFAQRQDVVWTHHLPKQISTGFFSHQWVTMGISGCPRRDRLLQHVPLHCHANENAPKQAICLFVESFTSVVYDAVTRGISMRLLKYIKIGKLANHKVHQQNNSDDLEDEHQYAGDPLASS